MPPEQHGPGIRLDDARDDPQQGRLPRPVGADHGDALTGLDVDVHRVKQTSVADASELDSVRLGEGSVAATHQATPHRPEPEHLDLLLACDRGAIPIFIDAPEITQPRGQQTGDGHGRHHGPGARMAAATWMAPTTKAQRPAKPALASDGARNRPATRARSIIALRSCRLMRRSR